ncbi:hypothetical protein EKD04_022545 [Chloroflexales bacterium ZM16-3]|nr:hypothetical protein [Chloroflexales bacterium ZM16-3]
MRRSILITAAIIGGVLTLIVAVALVLQVQTAIVTTDGPPPPAFPMPTVRQAVSDQQEGGQATLVPAESSPGASPPPAPSATVEALVEEPFTPLIYDDFTNLQSGWAVLYLDQRGNANGYSAESYMLDVGRPGEILYDVRSDLPFTPSHFAIEIHSAQGSGRFGLMFDVTGDSNNYASLSYYAITLTSDGEVGLIQQLPGQSAPQVLQVGNRLISPLGPERTLNLEIQRGSDGLVAYVDGQEVLRSAINTGDGSVGLLAFTDSFLRVQFDNLLLSAAPARQGPICAGLRLLFQPIGATEQARNDDVAIVQDRLLSLGYDPGPIDGIFGNLTAVAVRTFQTRNGLIPDSVVRPNTWCSLLSSDAIRADGLTERTENRARFRTIKIIPGVLLPAPLLLSVRGPDELWQIGLALPGRDELRYIDTQGDAFDPAWNPRTRSLAFTSVRANPSLGSIWYLNMLTGEVEQLSPPELDAQFPTWSPDGRTLIYTVETPGGGTESARNFRYDLATRQSVQWSDQHAGWSDWSVQDRVVFTRWTGRSFDIFVANGDGTGETNLTNSDDFDEDIPAWSPDGENIALVRSLRSSRSDRQVFVMRADGTGLRQLTTIPGPNSNPIWLDAMTIVFANQPNDQERQPYVIDLAGNMKQLSANEDRIWFMGRLDFQ